MAATLIGDVVGSRHATDRADLHTRLTAVLAEINESNQVVEPLRITVGDEFQGVFARVGEAIGASLRITLALLPEVDVRHGIGFGEVTVLQARPRVEDGPGWWAAREAIEAVKAAATRAASRERRTSYRLAADADGPPPAAVEAALVLRDRAVAGLSERSLSVLHGLVEGETQRAVAERLGITASAVSQRIRADGLGAIVSAHELLEEV